jgi:hypothetical protein
VAALTEVGRQFPLPLREGGEHEHDDHDAGPHRHTYRATR